VVVDRRRRRGVRARRDARCPRESQLTAMATTQHSPPRGHPPDKRTLLTGLASAQSGLTVC
jgi:hypothetical protein